MQVVRAVVGALLVVAAVVCPAAWADERGDQVEAGAVTVPDGVRVTLVRQGGVERVGSVSGDGGSGGGCSWSAVPASVSMVGDHVQVPLAEDLAESQMLYALLCDGSLHSYVWIGPEDVVDVDAAVRAEVERYVQDVLTPDIGIGVNPAASGLAGLRSWFWVEGFTGSVTAPPISMFGLVVEVRMASGEVAWDFGDGTARVGGLGEAYPAVSSVQHAHQDAGSFTVSAVIDLVPEYRVDGGPWTSLPALSVTASVEHPVEQRQAVITKA